MKKRNDLEQRIIDIKGLSEQLSGGVRGSWDTRQPIYMGIMHSDLADYIEKDKHLFETSSLGILQEQIEDTLEEARKSGLNSWRISLDILEGWRNVLEMNRVK
jgi:hypothetical protein